MNRVYYVVFGFLLVHSFSLSAEPNKGNGHIIPIYTHDLQTLEIDQAFGSLRIEGTSDPTGMMIVREKGGRPIQDISKLPVLKQTSPEKWLLKCDEQIHYDIRLVIPRVSRLVVHGRYIKVRVSNVNHLKSISIRAKTADGIFYQPRMNFNFDVVSGSFFVNRCHKCEGQVRLKHGNVYLQDTSGNFQIFGDKMTVVSDNVRGFQKIKVNAGEVRIQNAAGETFVRGDAPKVFLTGSLPSKLDIYTKRGNITLPKPNWANTQVKVKLPSKYGHSMPQELDQKRYFPGEMVEMTHQPKAFSNKINLHTLKGKIKFW